jgi:hypothetical protein
VDDRDSKLSLYKLTGQTEKGMASHTLGSVTKLAMTAGARRDDLCLRDTNSPQRMLGLVDEGRETRSLESQEADSSETLG